jgi:predicted nuclease of predicted toxin-antitoxin system
MPYLVDEDNSSQLAVIGRRLGLDILDVRECGHGGYSDELQLYLAGREGRCLITKNDADFQILTRQFQALGHPHAGVLIVSRSLDRRFPAAIARALALYDRLYPDGMPAYMIDYLHPAPLEP